MGSPFPFFLPRLIALFCLVLTGAGFGATKTPEALTPSASPVLPAMPTYVPHYFFNIDLDPARYEIVGRGALTEEASAAADCYRFVYDSKGRIQQIEYRRAGVPMPDPFFGVPRINFEYGDKSEHRWYVDAQGNAMKDIDNIYGEELTLDATGSPTDIYNLNETGARIRNDSGVIHYQRTLDNQGRLIAARRTGLLGTDITDSAGYFETRTVYDDQGRRCEYGNYDASGSLLNNEDGVALIRTVYTIFPDSLQVIESYFDASGVAAEEKSTGVHETQETIDNRGFVLSKAYFDVTGAPTCDAVENIHEDRSEYDERGNQLSESFYGVDGKLKTQRSAGYARVVYQYDAKNRVSEKAYFGDDGTPQVLLDLGAAVVRQEYDEQGNMTRRQFFDGQGHPSPHVQYGAPAIRIKVDGDITTVSLRNGDDRPMENPVNGYSTFVYNTKTDHPLTPTNQYFDRHGKRLILMRVFIINPHIHKLHSKPVMLWSARIGAAAVGLGALLAAMLALRKSSHTKRRKVYIPSPLERFLGWFSIFAIIEGTLRFVITIYWAWVDYQNGRIGSTVYVIETIVILFFLYRCTRMRVTMRVLNIGREDIERLVRDFLTQAHLDPKWIAERKTFITDALYVRVNYYAHKYHAYLSFSHIHRRDVARGLAASIRTGVGSIQGPPRSRLIAFYYPSVAICYFILAATAFYTFIQVLRH
jgi:hypothetical protein